MSKERVCMELKLDKKFIDEAVQKAVKDIKQNYIKKDVLDNIRAEIEALEEGITSYHNDRPWIFKDEALQIIDKYKGETEVNADDRDSD